MYEHKTGLKFNFSGVIAPWIFLDIVVKAERECENNSFTHHVRMVFDGKSAQKLLVPRNSSIGLV
jgi:hypothetical protein